MKKRCKKASDPRLNKTSCPNSQIGHSLPTDLPALTRSTTGFTSGFFKKYMCSYTFYSNNTRS